MRIRALQTLVTVLLITAAFPSSAKAAVEFCNRLNAELEVSFGYITTDGRWASKGWYQIPPNSCQIVHGADDIATVGNNAVYYYYASAFVGSSHLLWAGSKEDRNTRDFCIANDIYDAIDGTTQCESRGLIRQSFLPLVVPATPGIKHSVEFSLPTAQTSR